MTNNDFLKAVAIIFKDSNLPLFVSGSDRVVKNDITGEDLTPTQQELEDALVIANEQDKVLETYENRIREYGEIGSQLDMIYWDMVNGTETWKEHITSIKEKYPKGSV